VQLPDLPQAWVGFLAAGSSVPCYKDDGTTRRLDGEDDRDDPTTEDTRSGSLRDRSVSLSLEKFIEECIVKTLPKRAGQRHAAVFKFARYLRSNPEVAAWPLKRLRPIARKWYDSAVGALGSDAIRANADENWFDFAEGWDKVKYPGDEGMVTILLERARRNELPALAMNYESPEIRLLIGLCRELQRENGDDLFYLSTATIGRLFNLGENRMRPWRWLDGLVRDGILELVEKGDHTQRRPSRFRYLGD